MADTPKRETVDQFREQLVDNALTTYTERAVKLAGQFTKGLITPLEFYSENALLIVQCENAIFAVDPSNTVA